ARIDDDVVRLLYDGADGYDLTDDLYPTHIGRLDAAPETSLPPITVIHQTLFHRNPALFRISKSCRSSGIRDRYHHVCFERILPSKDPPQLSSCFVDVLVLDLATRMREVSVFKLAVMVWSFCKLCYGYT